MELYQFPFFPESIPKELKPGSCWVCCDRDKVPRVPLLRAARLPASSTNPDTWRTYSEAVAAYDARRYVGVGRVIEQDGGYVGVDVDGCRDPKTGVIGERGLRILSRLDSYSEVSPSGTGVKVWTRGLLPISYVKPGLEIYVRGRYFTITGQFLPQYSLNIEERSEELTDLVSEEFPRQTRKRLRSYQGRYFDLDKALENTTDIDVLAEVQDGEAERKYRIICPWIDQHSTSPVSGTYIGQYSSGAPFFWCWHSHCRGRKWADFRRAIYKRHVREFQVDRGSHGSLRVVVKSG